MKAPGGADIIDGLGFALRQPLLSLANLVGNDCGHYPLGCRYARFKLRSDGRLSNVLVFQRRLGAYGYEFTSGHDAFLADSPDEFGQPCIRVIRRRKEAGAVGRPERVATVP